MSSKAKPWKKQQGGKFKKKGRGFKKQQDDNVPRGTATPLHAAARAGDAATIAATVKEFQEKNAAAAVDARDEHGRTALHLACWAGHGGATRALLEAGAAPGLGAADDVTALHFAAQAGAVDAVAALVDAGAPLNAACTKSKKTALHFAAQRGRGDCVAALLRAGADASLLTRQRQTARDLATDASLPGFSAAAAPPAAAARSPAPEAVTPHTPAPEAPADAPADDAPADAPDAAPESWIEEDPGEDAENDAFL